MTDRTDHSAKAITSLDGARRADNPETAGLRLSEAQVHATLALVEQQRIANLLIALTSYEKWDSRGDGSSYATVHAHLHAEIREGLGL